jgi:hypothetical protein
MPSVPKNTISAAIAACATLLVPNSFHAAETDLSEIRREAVKRHDEAVKRLRAWIAAPIPAASAILHGLGRSFSNEEPDRAVGRRRTEVHVPLRRGEIVMAGELLDRACRSRGTGFLVSTACHEAG